MTCCIILSRAHELMVPKGYYQEKDFGSKGNLFSVLQLHRVFSESKGIINQLPDSAFSATHVHDPKHWGAHFGRIDPNQSSPSWIGVGGKVNVLTVDMMTSHVVTGVATQGRATNWHTKRYSVETSENGVEWVSHGQFVGNFDDVGICKVRFPKPVLARFVRFTILKYVIFPALRVDVLVYESG